MGKLVDTFSQSAKTDINCYLLEKCEKELGEKAPTKEVIDFAAEFIYELWLIGAVDMDTVESIIDYVVRRIAENPTTQTYLCK